MEQGFEYYAFISYKHEDKKWAKWLHRKIEGYRLPASIRKTRAKYPHKLTPVFLDSEEIQPGPLIPELKEKLEVSKYLIVICTPRSAKSKWVGEEIAHFISLGRANDIIPVIIEGTPYNDDSQVECFHLELRKEGLPEFLGVNINEGESGYGYIRREKAFIRVMSKMLDVSFDTLWQRHRKRRIKQAISLCVISLFILAAMAGIWRYNHSFDIQLSFSETSFHNEKLGFPHNGGKVFIYTDKDTLLKTFKNIDETLNFKDVAGHYRGTKSKLHFEMWGFAEIDTIIELKPAMILPVQRDAGIFGKVQGFVRNNLTDLFVLGVTVEVAGQITTTIANGYFALDIPLEHQQKSYEATLTYEGKVQEKQTVYPNQKVENLNNTLYIK